MDNNVHARERAHQAVAIANVADEVAHRRIFVIGEMLPHLVLLQLVAAEDDDFSGLVIAKNKFRELFAERPGAAGDQDYFVVQTHDWLKSALRMPLVEDLS
jgi:hypothetical protein